MLSTRQWAGVALIAARSKKELRWASGDQHSPRSLVGGGAGQGSLPTTLAHLLQLPPLREMAVSMHEAMLLLHRTR